MKSAIFCAAVAACLTGSAPASAGVSFGFGLSYSFGGGIAIGARVFSTDKPKSGALELGLDYDLVGNSLRPVVGAAYLGTDAYADFSVGVDMHGGPMSFGIGVGGLSGMQNKVTAPPPPPPA